MLSPKLVVYFTLDDDGDVFAARPTPLAEVRPQPGVLRHTAVHIVDILSIETFVACSGSRYSGAAVGRQGVGTPAEDRRAGDC